MTTPLTYLVEITAHDGATTTTLRYASGRGTMTLPSEAPANAWFAPRLMQPISFKRTMFASARVAGGATVGTGEIVLNNLDQELASLRDYGIDGRAVVVRIGPQGAAYPSGYTTVLTGTAEQATVGAADATIRLRDKLHILTQPLQATLYAGTNSLPSGAEGTADDIKGQRKPLLFGRRYQIEPVLVNTAKLIYQFHDGAAQAVDAVYDQGVALTAGTTRANLAAMEATAPAAGAYDTCLSLGLIRLGASPSGRVTLDARGDATGGYVDTAAEIVSRILTQRCGVAGGDLDSATFTALASAAGYECGAYFTGETTRQQAIDTVLASVGGWLAPDRAGVWQVGRLVAPSGSATFEFTDVDILALETQAPRDADAGVPVWRVKLRGLPYTELARSDLAGAVSEADKARLLQPWREVTASDSSVQTKHLLAPEMVRDTAIQDATDLATEAARLLALHKVRRDFVQTRVALTQDNAAVDLGDVVALTTARLGYGSGRDFVVVGIDADGKRKRLTLDLWG
jgi:hypothetical protein